jgi:glycosyltransferase involved in cell wall biosynthesis
MAPASNKRLDCIIHAVADLPASCRAHLVIAGSASPEQELDLLRRVPESLRGRVHVFANRAHEEMHTLYQSADVFAHAALREPFGIVFLEAMACGLPVAAHQFEVTSWIVGPGGATVDMQTPAALTSLLVRWHANPGLRHELGALARERAVCVFAPDKIVPLYQQMYQTIRDR